MATDMGNGSYVADNQLKPPAGFGRVLPDGLPRSGHSEFNSALQYR
jgi:hypothetical protein